jgi:glycerol uptake facilitator-like aquaporin
MEEAKTAGEDMMEPLGWIFMAVSWGLIILLAVFCFYRIFRKKEVD